MVAGVVAVGDIDDRLPHGSRGLDGGRFGLEARLPREADALVGDSPRVLGGGAVELKEVDHAGGRAGPRKAAQAGGGLPHGQHQGSQAAEQASRAVDRGLGVLGAVVAEDHRIGRGLSHGDSSRCIGGKRDVEQQRAGPTRCSSVALAVCSYGAPSGVCTFR
ncbi:MAG: hypothetical protein DLM63_02400 [Solirubrobacterales bacterium]|nr:MAG: hypothetical protein DLM63_02400 [Solirubrobacterales bacterium]